MILYTKKNVIKQTIFKSNRAKQEKSMSGLDRIDGTAQKLLKEENLKRRKSKKSWKKEIIKNFTINSTKKIK